MMEGAISRRRADVEETIGLKTRHEQTTIDPKALEEAVQNALKDYFPRPEATANVRTQFYKDFQHEADEHDRDTVGKYNADLDTTLIFAGLFSAVTSAFILAVQTQLQPDYNQLNYDILWAFADSTGLNSTGRIPAKPSSDSPWTGPDHALIHIQAILLSSLSASLFAAFVAMLGKQWLNRYSRTDLHGSLVDRCRDRQRKMNGMRSWGFLLVMESLPLMLQAALLLLGSALSKYLFTINNLIAWVVLGFTVAGSLFYVFIVLAAIVSYDCPFQTPLPLIIRFVINFDRKHTKYLERSGRWFQRKFPLRRGLCGFGGNDAHNDAGDHAMVGPFNRPPISLDENTKRDFVLDANCIAWMFEVSVDADVILDIMKFIPEVVWHTGIKTTPLEKLYDTVLECFDSSSARPVVALKFRNKAYLSAKALLHVAIHRKCMGADNVVFDSISRRHPRNIGSEDYDGYSDLGATLGMVDRVFRPDGLGPMDWDKFSFSVPHHTWMAQILSHHSQYVLDGGNHLPDDIKLFVLRSLALDYPPPAVITGCLDIIGSVLRIRPRNDDQQVADRSHAQITNIYSKITGILQNVDAPTAALERAVEAMRLIAPLSRNDIAMKSYRLFRVVIQVPLSPARTEETKWEACRLALHGTCKSERYMPPIEDALEILRFLDYHFGLADGGDENTHVPIGDALRALESATDPIMNDALQHFDPAGPSFVRGIRHALQKDKPLLRKAVLLFLPRIADRWFVPPREIMTPDETKSFCKDWASAVDEVGVTCGIRAPALDVLFHMINSSHWRPHIVADKWRLLEYFTSDLDDSPSFRRCLGNPEVVDAILSGDRAVMVLWSKILLLRYKDLTDDVLRRFGVAMEKATGRELEVYMSTINSELAKAELELTRYKTLSSEERAVTLRREIDGHKEARVFLKRFKSYGR